MIKINLIKKVIDKKPLELLAKILFLSRIFARASLYIENNEYEVPSLYNNDRTKSSNQNAKGQIKNHNIERAIVLSFFI